MFSKGFLHKNVVQSASFHVGNKIYLHNSVRLCSSPIVPDKFEPVEWYPFYKLPMIRWAAAVNRLKIYQAGLTAVTVPAAYAFEQMGHISSGSAMVAAVIGITGTITLTVFSMFSTNLIGFLYTNADGSRVKISYINFWGSRQNIESAVDDIIPASESKKQLLTFYIPVKFYSSKNRLRLLHVFGEFSDFTQFARIFGDYQK